jgi:3-oxoacyl-[acyl-carrier protein] reductase
VSRRAGLGFAVARGLLALGADVVVHHHAAHDAAQPWGADDVPAVIAALDRHRRELGAPGVLAEGSGDLTVGGAPERLVADAVVRFGRVDVLVANHARSAPDAGLGGLTAEILDGHWAVDARSVILLVQAFAAGHDGGCGRVVLLTSGQVVGPMPGEVAYAAAKAALAGVTPTLADEVADRGITLNTVNPGPVDTGYASGAAYAEVARRFPGGRWATPDDPARLITWLCTDDAAWVTGQVISTEGGFRR